MPVFLFALYPYGMRTEVFSMKEKVNQIKGQYTEAAMAGGVSQSLGSQMNPFMSIRELTVSGLLAGITISSD